MLSSLRVVPLGGCGEFGRNLTVYDAGRALLAVDCGGQIPDDEAPGVELFIPDFTWLEARAAELCGWVLTHAHEDHVAALAWALEVAPAPVYARPLTLALVRAQLAARGRTAPLYPLVPGAVRQLGPFRVEALEVAHSIPDACALAIGVDGRTVVHTGDLKLDPAARHATDVARLGALGESGVDLLVADSTNATRPGRAGAESEVARALAVELERAPKRIAFSLFASNVQRLGALLDACAHRGRRVCIEGRGLREMMAAALEVGALRPPAGLLVDAATAAVLPPAAVALVVTGSQGEPRAALARIASGEHPLLSLGHGDTVVMSSRPVPGNERQVARVVDRLVARGVTIADAPALHASGHACQEELRDLLRLVRPRALLPIHGNLRQLAAHAALAEAEGVLAHVLADGDVLEVDAEGVRLGAETVPAGRVSIEGEQLGDVDGAVLKARRHMAETGVVVVARVDGALRVAAEGIASEEAVLPLIAAAESAAGAAWVASAGEANREDAVRLAVRRVFFQARGKKPRVIVLV